ncbi:MAG: hypothetical protein ABSA79_12245 [Candidatus Bathyarchaeia archaeon]|jgi:hypothetical protein
MSTAQQKFDQLLVEAIDEVLGSLGEPVKNHVYIHLENDFSITKNELPQKIEEFSHFLLRIFGSSAYHLEIKFMKTLYAKISADQHFKNQSIAFKEIDLTFSAYVNAMRESFEISRY